MRAFLMAISFLLASMAFLMVISCLLALHAFLMMTFFSVTSTSWQELLFFPSWPEFSFLPSWQEFLFLPLEVVMAMTSSVAACTCPSSPRHS